jgi:hypothetical protein
MRWGLIGGAVVAAGAAAYVGTQLMQGDASTAGGGNTSASAGAGASAPPARGQPAPTKAAIEAGLKEAFGASGQALVSAGVAASLVAGMQPGVTPSGEQTRTTTDQVPAEDGKPAGTRSTTVTTRVEGSGSRRTVFTDFKISERRGDSGFNLRGKLTATVNVCPDAEGVVPFDIDLQASGDNHFGNVVGTGGFSVNFSAKGSGRATVDDSATLTGYRKEIGGDYSIRGGENLSGKSVGGTGEAKMRVATDGSFKIGSSSTVSIETRSGGTLGVGIGDSRIETASTGGSASQEGSIKLGAMMNSVVDNAIRTLLQSAQNAWRGGECVEVVVAPPLRSNGEKNRTQPRERKDIEARVRHKIEGRELPLPIDATLAGKDQLEPKRVERAPGRFGYTAGPDEQDWGRADLKTVSRRGIGEASVDFTNRGEWSGSFKVASTGGPMKMTMTGTVTWRPKAGSDTEFEVDSGSYTITAERRDCTAGTSSGKLGPGDGELEVKRNDKGEVQGYRGIGMKPITFNIVCPKSRGSPTMPAPWFATGEAFRPLAGNAMQGTLRDPEGHWQWDWNFTR